MVPRTGFEVLMGVLALCGGLAAHAGTAWDEAGGVDLSNNGLNPTPLVVSVGSNTVLGTVGNSGQGIDRDYFRFTVPAGAVLQSIRVLGNTSVSGGASFIAIQAGPQLTVSPSGAGVEQLLGFTHYGNDQIGNDILQDMAISFSGALPAGTYSVWVQETGGPASYGLDFMIGVVGGVNTDDGDVPTLPEWAAILMALLLSFSLWRRGVGAQPRA